MARSSLPRRPLVWLNVLFLTAFPVVTLAATVWYALTFGITWREISAAIACWILTGLGITAGYHRLFAHKGYKAHPAVRLVYALLGAAAAQNSAIAWCSDHRHHHTETDTDGDPYDATRGFWYSHMGWVFFEGLRGDAYANVPDLRKDPVLAWQHRNWLSISVVVNLALIGAASLLLGRALGMFIIAGMLRIVVVQHTTFLINSAAHMWGSQPWSGKVTARDNWFLSLFTLGEGYHNYHHAFQWDYRNGPRWYNWDPTKWLIWALSRVGLTTDLRRTPVDVVLQARYEEGRKTFVERLEAWGEDRSDDWRSAFEDNRAQLAQRRDQFIETLRTGQTALRDQLLEAEASLELAIAELKARRTALSELVRRAASEGSDELRVHLEQELKHLRRSLKESQRAAKAALKGWEQLVDAYSTALPTPA